MNLAHGGRRSRREATSSTPAAAGCHYGRLDVNPAELRPIDQGATIIGASSDHLVLDMTQAQSSQVGGQLEFDMGYPAVLQAMISPYVKKRILVCRHPIDCSDVMPFRVAAQLLPGKHNHAFY